MRYTKGMKRWLVVFSLVIVVLLVCGGAVFWLAQRAVLPAASTASPTPTTDISNAPAPTTPQATTSNVSSFNKTQYSTTDASSIWVIANKKFPLPSGYAPAKLVTPNVPLRLEASAEQMHVSAVTAPPLEALFAAANKAGVSIKLSSGYRSEALQKQFYDSYVAKDGQAAADTYSARPGTSEHQTGLAVDIMAANNKCSLETCFADTPEGQWLKAHAHEYGFIIRYLDGKQAITTYQYEPWHIRYVGPELATELAKNNLTMEEFFTPN